MKLMIVDDHPGVRKMIRQLATSPADVVCECASGDEAVRRAPEFQPDRVTMDVRMPGMCSFEATRAILTVVPSARIIVVSSYDEPVLRQVASESGVAGYLGKENLSELRAVLMQDTPPIVPAATVSGKNRNEADHSTDRERVLQARIRQLEAELVERESFPAFLAHELRTPVRAIMGFGDLLKRHHADVLGPEALNWLQIIVERGQTMNQRIENLTQLAQSHRQMLPWETISTDQLVADAWRNLGLELAPQNIQFTARSLPPIRGDRELLYLVFENFFGNAVKFTSQNPRPVIEVGGNLRDDEAVFYVRDNGIGFEMSQATRLFQLLSRLHAASEFPGTGLGLALVRRIICQHGGRVWAEGAAGQGATFYFSLPRQTHPPLEGRE